MNLSRRKFLAQVGIASSAGVTLAATGAGSSQSAAKPILKADVLVVGGGTAGTIAAIQASRLGASTMLVEHGSQLGGTTTTAGVDFPGLFHAWGKQVIAGIGWELVTRTVAMNGDALPDFKVPTGPQHWRHQVRICGPLYAALAEEECLKAGVKLRYYESPLSITSAPDGWKVTLVGKSTRADVLARQVIDCTGNAAVCGMAGLAREREEQTQPGTLVYRLGGYTFDPKDEERLGALNTAVREAVREGRLQQTDFNHSIGRYLAAQAQNAMHLLEANSSTSELHTSTNTRARASFLRMFRFLKEQPGFEALKVERLQPECGVRETWRVVGETKITHEDYVSGRKFEDAVAYSFYPVDLHDEKGVRPKHLSEGTVPTIPVRALIPKGSRNIMVAGRCISSDRLANSALRVQASCMAMGQAAGATAALAVLSSTTPLKVPLRQIKSALKSHDAIVP